MPATHLHAMHGHAHAHAAADQGCDCEQKCQCPHHCAASASPAGLVSTGANLGQAMGAGFAANGYSGVTAAAYAAFPFRPPIAAPAGAA